MFDDSADPFAADEREFHRIFLVIEDVVSFAIGEGAIGMHSASVDASHRLWHESGQLPVFMGDEFDDLFESLNVVAGLEDIGEAEVDFVLARRDFVMGGLDDKPKFL